MAIEDILSKLPKVFGTTPEAYRGLLSPEQSSALESRANIGGLLGSLSALSQGMSPQGYRRSPLQNILTSLAAGYGAAGQTYESGLNQVSNAMKLAQSQRQLTGLAAMRKAHPDLAYLADVSPDEFVRQVSARERAKMYGLTPTTTSPAPSVIPSAAPAVVEPPVVQPPVVEPAPAGLIASDGGGFIGGGYGSVGTTPPAQPAPAPAVPAPAIVPSGAAPSAAVPSPVSTVPAPSSAPTQLVSPKNQAEADRLFQQAVLADSLGDKFAADEFRRRAEILSPKEQFFYRDGVLVSSKQGKIAQYQQTETLSPEQAAVYGLPTNKGQIWQREPSGKISRIDGTESTELDKTQLIKTLPGQFSNIYPTLQNRANNLISRASSLTKDQINKETESILEADSKILADLDPKLQAAEMARRKASKTDLTVYTGALSKTAAGEVEKGVLTDAAAITRLNNIQFSYRPEYQNIQYRGKQAWNTLADKVFRDKLPESEKRQLTEYSQYKQNSLQNLNQTIKDLTGAAMGVQEADRIITSLPNAGTGIFDGDSPTEFEAKLNNAVQQTKYSLMRKNYALKNGLKWENIALEKMPSIIQERGKQIEKQYKLDPKDPATKATVLRQLSAEFGVPF